MEDGTITVCIGNYGYYNEGELHDAWITLPKSEEEIQRFLSDNRLQDAMHEEIYISDYDGIPFGLSYGNIFSEYTSLSDLNLLAKQMQLNPNGVHKVEEALDCGIDSPDNILGLMNWIEQANDIPYYSYDFEGIENCPNMSAEEKYGYTLAEQTGAYQILEEHDLTYHFDFAGYGRAEADDGYVDLGEDGYIVTSLEMPSEDYFSREELSEQIENAWRQEFGADDDEPVSLSAETKDMQTAKNALLEGRQDGPSGRTGQTR